MPDDQRRQLARMIYGTLRFAIFFSFVGTVPAVYGPTTRGAASGVGDCGFEVPYETANGRPRHAAGVRPVRTH